ncbi:MAG: GIY-YIG nuclease family protein [Chitinophagaceae bacterium]|nr:MAG: GIY-YIG nuclease family protein [Chitinophagaceae bacterium]
MYYVYILKCNDSGYYIGCTSDLKERIKRHLAGHVFSTSGRLPVALVHYAAFGEKYKAFEYERYLKGGSGRAFMNKRLI